MRCSPHHAVELVEPGSHRHRPARLGLQRLPSAPPPRRTDAVSRPKQWRMETTPSAAPRTASASTAPTLQRSGSAPDLGHRGISSHAPALAALAQRAAPQTPLGPFDTSASCGPSWAQGRTGVYAPQSELSHHISLGEVPRNAGEPTLEVHRRVIYSVGAFQMSEKRFDIKGRNVAPGISSLAIARIWRSSAEVASRRGRCVPSSFDETLEGVTL